MRAPVFATLNAHRPDGQRSSLPGALHLPLLFGFMAVVPDRPMPPVAAMARVVAEVFLRAGFSGKEAAFCMRLRATHLSRQLHTYGLNLARVACLPSPIKRAFWLALAPFFDVTREDATSSEALIERVAQQEQRIAEQQRRLDELARRFEELIATRAPATPKTEDSIRRSA